MLDKLLALQDTKVSLVIASTDEVEVSYYGTLTQVNEETERFVIKPRTVNTLIKGRIYEAAYSSAGGPSEIGFDIDVIESINEKEIKIESF